MKRFQKQFVIYISIFLCMSHSVKARKFDRDLTINVAPSSLSNLPNLLGGSAGILSNPVGFVKSLIPNPGCGFNCGHEERMQQHFNHPPGHKHHPPQHSNGFHGNPHYQQWPEMRKPHPIYGAPYEHHAPPGHFHHQNKPQYQQQYQYGQYQAAINPSYYQQTPFIQSSATPNNFELPINHEHETSNTGFYNPMTNQPNIVENIPFNAAVNAATGNIYEENPTQTLNSGIIIHQPNIIQGMSQVPAAHQPSIVDTVYSPIYNPGVSSVDQANIFQIIPQQPTSDKPELMETETNFPNENEANLTPTEQPAIVNPTTNNMEEVNPIPEQSINPNEETSDFLYPDSALYSQKKHTEVDDLNTYPLIDIRRLRSVF